MEKVKKQQVIISYDETNVSENPFHLIDQDTESIMRELEASHGSAED